MNTSAAIRHKLIKQGFIVKVALDDHKPVSAEPIRKFTSNFCDGRTIYDCDSMTFR
jgi:hypothetical protein